MKVSSAIRKVMDYIVNSEMGGKVDTEDPYYTAYLNLDELLQKVLDEEDDEMALRNANKKGA